MTRLEFEGQEVVEAGIEVGKIEVGRIEVGKVEVGLAAGVGIVVEFVVVMEVGAGIVV